MDLFRKYFLLSIYFAVALCSSMASYGQATVDVYRDARMPSFFNQPIDTTTTTIPVDEAQTLALFVRISTPTTQVSIRAQVSDSNFVDANFSVSGGPAATLAILTKSRIVTAAQSADPILLRISGIDNGRIGDNSGTYLVTLDFIDATGNDDNFDSVSTTLTVALEDDGDTAGIIVRDGNSPTDNELTTIPDLRELGNSGATGNSETIYISLAAQPSSNVTINAELSDGSDVRLGRSSFTITPTNYNQGFASAVIVTRSGNNQFDPIVQYTLTIQATSDDDDFDGLSKEITGRVFDDEARVQVHERNRPTSVTEGDTAEYRVSIRDKVPTSDVTVTINSDRPDLLSTNTQNLTFSAGVTGVIQTFTVTATDNNVIDDDQTVDISFSVSSADDDYNSFLIPTYQLAITNTDDAVVMIGQLLPTIDSEESGVSVLLVELDIDDTLTGRTSFLTSTVVLSVTTQSTIVTVENSLLTFSAETFGESHYGDAQGVRVSSGPLERGQEHEYTLTVAVVNADSYFVFDNLPDQTVIGTVIPAPAIVVSPSTLPEIEEGGSTTFAPSISRQPQNEVVLSVRTSNSDDIEVSPSEVTFTRYNWDQMNEEERRDISLNIKVTSKRSNVEIDPAENYEITVSVDDIKSDSDFRSVADVTLTGTVSADVAGFTINPQTFNNIAEGGNEATISIALDAQPSDDVTVTFTSSHPSDTTLSAAELTFPSSDWNVFQAVTVTSGADVSSDVLFTITASVSGSGTDFNGVSDTITGVIIDDDKSGELLFDSSSIANIVIIEDDLEHTVAVSLNMVPTNDVTLTFIPSLSLVTVDALTIEASTATIAQTFTISAEQNDVLEGSRDFSIIVSATSVDSNFNNINTILQGMINDDRCDVYIYAVVEDQCAPTEAIRITNPPLQVDTSGDNVVLNDLDEGSGETTFSFELLIPTTNIVTVSLSSSTPEVTLSSNLNISDWMVPQTITITPPNNVTGDLAYTVSMELESEDEAYDHLYTFVGNIIDNDKSGELVFDTPSIVITEGGEPLDVAVSLNVRPDSSVTLTFSSSFLIESLDENILNSGNPVDAVTLSTTELIFTTNNWFIAQTFPVTPRADNEEQEGDLDFNIIVKATSTDSDFVIAKSLPATIRDDDDAVLISEENQTEIQSAIAVADTFGVANIATDLITARLQSPSTSRAQFQLANLSQSEAVTNPTRSSINDPWADETVINWDNDWAQLLPGSEFVLPLSHRDSGGGSWELWGAAAYTSLNGDPTVDDVQVNYDGQATGLQVGVTRRFANGANAGVSIGTTQVELDLTNSNTEKIERDLLSLHPYISWTLANGLDVWLIAGYGDGDVEITQTNKDVIKTDGSLVMFGGGLQQSWDLNNLGLSLSLEANSTRSELKETTNFEKTESSATTARAEFEVSYSNTSANQSLLQPYATLGYRHDGGDLGGSGAGEVGLGIRAQISNAWLADLKTRFQITDSDHERHSVQGFLKYDRNADQRGLLFSINHRLDYETDEAGDNGTSSHEIAGNLGYGWGLALFKQRGIFDVHLRANNSDADNPVVGLGFNSPSLQMSLDGNNDEVKANFNYVVSQF